MAHDPPDDLFDDLIELGGAGVAVTELDGDAIAPSPGSGMIHLGVHRNGPAPENGLERFDILLSARPDAPRPWVGLADGALDPAIDRLVDVARRQPAATTVLIQVLRTTLGLSFDQALTLESMGYSMLLGASGFRTWRDANPPRPRDDALELRVNLAVKDDQISIALARPAARNAFDARMRDDLAEALAFALDHPDAPVVTLSGEGPCFSAGGDLAEFGSAPDVGAAHLIRTVRSPARLIHALGDRIIAQVHGACVGAGIEAPAAARRIVARPGSTFRLPEVGMGLIPGAGGTASIPRRIGRRRAGYMAMSGTEIDLATALAWGLVDEVAA